MSDARVHRMVSEVTVAAPAGVLYGLIADATRWPLFFQPCVHVEQLDFDGSRERLRMWATAGGTIASWVSRRELDVGRRRVTFHQDLTEAPVESMSGVWTVRPLGDRCRVVLEHTFTVIGDVPADVAWVERVTRANSRAQLDRLAQLAACWTRLDELVLSFEDTVRFKGPAEVVFDFLYRAEDWPGRLPHVRALDLVEDTAGVQVMAMDSLGADGGAHRTESVRICFPAAGRLVYKQTLTSPLLAAHTGEWSLTPDERGVTLTARHDVLLREDAAATVAGAAGGQAGLAAAGRHVRDELGRDCLLVLQHAVRHAAGAVRVL
ncbi:aromatase/cyclase [Streptomyces sp. NPDC101776]|uniref:aromatase/cyclase n=1 Tax=Streptomyces sp. NPDC101776 TaxID=3366146 RepID=UPI0037F422B4